MVDFRETDMDDMYDCEEGTMESWRNCLYDEDDDRHEECDNCELKEKCFEDAEDARSGYAAFCDCIIGCGYESMDDFWECNGI